MKKTIGLFSAMALVAAMSVPALAQPTVSLDDSPVNVANDGGINSAGNVNKDESGNTITDTDTKTITKTDTKTITKTNAEDGGINNMSSGTVNAQKDSGNTLKVDVDLKATKNEAKDGGIVATDSAQVTTTKDSNNDSHDVKVKAEDGSVAAQGNVSNSNNRKDVDITGSFNKQETEIKVGDVSVMVSTADLKGEVENNRIEVEHRSEIETGDIKNKGDAFSTINGITVVKQNTGINSQMQTSINVNATVSK